MDGLQWLPLDKFNFVPSFKSMKADTIIIGSSLIYSKESGPDTFDKQESFQGQISDFLVYPFEITAEDIQKTCTNSNRALLRKRSLAHTVKEVLDKDKKSSLNHENSVLDLNTFINIERSNNIHQEIIWNVDPQISQSSPKKSFSLFGGKYIESLLYLIIFDRKRTSHSDG